MRHRNLGNNPGKGAPRVNYLRRSQTIGIWGKI